MEEGIGARVGGDCRATRAPVVIPLRKLVHRPTIDPLEAAGPSKHDL